MDPSELASAEWADLGNLLTGIWIILGLVVFFSTNMLVGHVLIPSLVASQHLPSAAQRTRPLFYALSILTVAAVVAVLVFVIDSASVIERIYDTYWIDGGTD